MGQVTVHVTLTNARELVMSRLGHLAPEAVHTCQVEARVDTGTMRSVFVENGNLSDVFTPTDLMGVTLAPASIWLVGIERALAGEVGAETLLRRAVSELDPGAWDYILIDCPPR